MFAPKNYLYQVQLENGSLPLSKTPLLDECIPPLLSFTLIPQPLLPKREKGSSFKVPRPLGEGFRVRECKVGIAPLLDLGQGL